MATQTRTGGGVGRMMTWLTGGSWGDDGSVGGWLKMLVGV